MDKNVPRSSVDQSSSTTKTSLPLEQEQTVTSGFSSSSLEKNTIAESEISLPASYASSNKETMISNSSSTSKFKTDVDRLDDLVKDLLNEVNLPRHEERTQPQTTISSTSVDEQLIDSLLESVQNTLRKRAQRASATSSHGRAHSSTSTYADSVHRIEPNRSRFPIKINRTDSPTSTVSSRRGYSRRDSRDGYISSSSATIPTHSRATSEPPPEGPIELHRMDLIRSPSRTYFDRVYPRSTLPTRGYRSRSYDYPGYETDTGPMMTRYYRAPVPPAPIYPYYPQRAMFRPDGYDTDSGLISSGRLRMTRSIPSGSSRMAVIPETVIFNNRMGTSSSSNLKSRYAYDIDVNRHSRQIPVQHEHDRSTWRRHEMIDDLSPPSIDDRRQFRSTSIPVMTEQEQRKTNLSAETSKTKDRSISPKFFAASVGLSNPIILKKDLPSNVKHSLSKDQSNKRVERPQGILLDEVVVPSSVAEDPSKTDSTTTTVNIDVPITKASITTTVPVINQSYNANVQPRISNSASRHEEENSQRSSLSSATDSDFQRAGAYQAHNVSQFWYKKKMSREDAINLLKNRRPGTFLIRDSQGFPGSFGLAVKVETLPAGIHPKPGADPEAELVRHYLIERTPTSHVRLKGCPNEPDFASLSELVYHHTLTPLALPIKLVLPTSDITENYRPIETKKTSIKDLLQRGAACNVIYLNCVDVGSLSGQMAVAKALTETFEHPESLQAILVSFKVSDSGITLLDLEKKKFSRRNFPKEIVIYCGADYETHRYWTHHYEDLEMLPRAKCFAFVSKKIDAPRSSSTEDNECHIFAEVDPAQPASAIVNFVSKVMIGSVPV